MRRLALTLALLTAACSSRAPADEPDAGSLDAGASVDAGSDAGAPGDGSVDAAMPVDSGAGDGGSTDGGPSDGGPSDGGPSDGGPSDGGPSDGGVRDAGEITPGECSSGPCPPTCFRPYRCVTVCGGLETACGCCPCAEGSIDTITCP